LLLASTPNATPPIRAPVPAAIAVTASSLRVGIPGRGSSVGSDATPAVSALLAPWRRVASTVVVFASCAIFTRLMNSL
jgi:hypothetical protein